MFAQECCLYKKNILLFFSEKQSQVVNLRLKEIKCSVMVFSLLYCNIRIDICGDIDIHYQEIQLRLQMLD